MRTFSLVTLVALTDALCAPLALAEPPAQPHAGELRAALDRLAVVGNVLYVAAHPDDENTRLLAYLAGAEHLRTAYLSITRGDGGQNLVGSEQGPLLGVIRTQELLAARRIDHAEQTFTRAVDFGYSKRADETLAIWNRDEVLADVVWAIRRFKPDVVINRFSTTGGDTHGHHTASAILALEAFKLAGDPKYRPEQVALAGVWQPKRIVWNRSMWNAKPNEDLSAFLALDIGGYSALLGVSWGELAADSRSMHKSQGFGAARTRGTTLEYFKPLAGDATTKGIFDGVDRTWARVPGSGDLVRLLAAAQGAFDPERPEALIPFLLSAKAALDKLPENPWKAAKQRELVELVAACAGLFAEAQATDHSAVAGAPVAAQLSALVRRPAQLVLREVRWSTGQTASPGKALAPGAVWKLEQAVPLPAEAPHANPYWLDDAPAQGLYQVREPALIGQPENAPALFADFTFAAGSHTFTIRRAAMHRFVDPVAGERFRPLEVLPPVTLNPRRPVLLSPNGAAAELRVRVKSSIPDAAGVVRPALSAGWTAVPTERPFKLGPRGAEAELTFEIQPPPGAGVAEGTLRAVAIVGGRELDRGLLRIEHSHIPTQTLLPRAEVKLVRFPLKRGKTRIGYIPGAGDQVPAALEQAGYAVTTIDDDALESRPLDRFDAIVIGVRAYNVNRRLPFVHAKLMKWVEAGGVLVAQYSTQNRLSTLPPEMGPHKIELSQERVTEERAAVTFALPEHATLAHPNRITAADFEGWIQERGLYFAGKWSDRYEAPLAMHDAGEPERKGSLLVVAHGKGRFVYTGLAFFRQLPAGVPGAFRLFANLLALPKAVRGR